MLFTRKLLLTIGTRVGSLAGVQPTNKTEESGARRKGGRERTITITQGSEWRRAGIGAKGKHDNHTANVWYEIMFHSWSLIGSEGFPLNWNRCRRSFVINHSPMSQVTREKIGLCANSPPQMVEKTIEFNDVQSSSNGTMCETEGTTHQGIRREKKRQNV